MYSVCYYYCKCTVCAIIIVSIQCVLLLLYVYSVCYYYCKCTVCAIIVIIVLSTYVYYLDHSECVMIFCRFFLVNY